MNVLLTIVVPAYNVAAYIERCLESLLSGRSDGRVEVIMVDDGSTDRTTEIAAGLNREGRFRIVTQPNLGLGSARNTGLDAARGKYVWFVDGDDWLKPGSIDNVISQLAAEHCDVMIVNFSCANEMGEPIHWISSPFTSSAGRVIRGAEFFSRYHAITYAWLYIVRRSLLAEHDLRFQPRINMQDAELIPRVLAVADSVYVSGVDAYVYVKRAGSFINSTSPATRERYFESVLEVRRRLGAFRQGVTDKDMLAGLAAKLGSIRRILLMAFVYDTLDGAALQRRLDLLKADGVHPFEPLPDETLKERFVRNAVNLCPILFPLQYRWIRDATRGLRSTGSAKATEAP